MMTALASGVARARVAGGPGHAGQARDHQRQGGDRQRPRQDPPVEGRAASGDRPAARRRRGRQSREARRRAGAGLPRADGHDHQGDQQQGGDHLVMAGPGGGDRVGDDVARQRDAKPGRGQTRGPTPGPGDQLGRRRPGHPGQHDRTGQPGAAPRQAAGSRSGCGWAHG